MLFPVKHFDVIYVEAMAHHCVTEDPEAEATHCEDRGKDFRVTEVDKKAFSVHHRLDGSFYSLHLLF